MPQVYCLEWLDDDPDLGMREDGFSLHLTEADANAFSRERQSTSCVSDPEGAYCVEVPQDLYDEVRSSRNGVRRTLPREPRFPRANETPRTFYCAMVGPLSYTPEIYWNPGDSYRLNLSVASLQKPADASRTLAVLTDEEVRTLRGRGFNVQLLSGSRSTERQAEDSLDESWANESWKDSDAGSAPPALPKPKTPKTFFFGSVGPVSTGAGIYASPGVSYRLNLDSPALERPSGASHPDAVLTDQDAEILASRGFRIRGYSSSFASEREAEDFLDFMWDSDAMDCKFEPEERKPPAPSSARIPSETVGGRYRIASMIQRLEWCDAFAAIDIQTSTPYVVKIGTAESVPMFQRAYETIVAVDHNLFVRSVDIGLLDDQRPYLVEESVQGPTLQEVRREKELSLNQTLDILTGIAEGLSAAHRKGVFGFDIAPWKTVLLEQTGQGLFRAPRLTDSLLSYGHLRAAAPAENFDGMMGGGADRFSPEEIRGQKTTPATDVYRLGSLGFFALVGRLPFRSDSMTTSFYRIVNEAATFPEDIPAPALLQELILHFLRTDPAARPPDGQAALEAIRKVRRKLG